MCPHIKVAELNTLSDGKGITGRPSAVCLMRWKKNKKNWFFKCKFKKYIMVVLKHNVPAHKSCRIEYSFRWKRNYRNTYCSFLMTHYKVKKMFKIVKKINWATGSPPKN